MEDQELLRYSKQIMLPQVDVEGQHVVTCVLVGQRKRVNDGKGAFIA